MDRKDWKELFAPRILQRGLAYYREGAVEMLQVPDAEFGRSVLSPQRSTTPPARVPCGADLLIFKALDLIV